MRVKSEEKTFKLRQLEKNKGELREMLRHLRNLTKKQEEGEKL